LPADSRRGNSGQSAHAVYRELYALYKKLHDAFGTKDWSGNLHDVMKELLAIRGRVRK
jgi:L-ribulokinase